MPDKIITRPPKQSQQPAFASNVLTENKQSRKLKPPAMYALIMLNDDFTPMEFVIDVLIQFVHMPNAKAHATMLQVHNDGEARCGVYTRDIGETKIHQIHTYAKEHDHPLRCILRKTEG